jgi:hypothetical protein
MIQINRNQARTVEEGPIDCIIQPKVELQQAQAFKNGMGIPYHVSDRNWRAPDTKSLEQPVSQALDQEPLKA